MPPPVHTRTPCHGIDSSFRAVDKILVRAVGWHERNMRPACGSLCARYLHNQWDETPVSASLDRLRSSKGKISVTADPGVVNQQRYCPVVAVRVDRPMCEYYVGMFGLENFGEVSVPGRAYFRIVNLSGKYRPRPQDRSSPLTLSRANGRSVRRTLTWDPRSPRVK